MTDPKPTMEPRDTFEELPDNTIDDTSPGQARIPCPDGRCTGIIGEDGRCGSCGAMLPESDENSEGEADISTTQPMRADDTDRLLKFPDNPDADPVDLDNRQLCEDGACTGVVGPDGRCRECGRQH